MYEYKWYNVILTQLVLIPISRFQNYTTKNVVATPLNPWDSQSQNPPLQICLANKLMYVPISSNKSA